MIPVHSGTASSNTEVLPDGRLQIGDAIFAADELGAGYWRVVSGDRADRLWIAGPPDAPWICYDGHVYRLRVGDAPADRSAHHDDQASLSAPMPATVRAVLVAAGQAVARGDTVIVLEAMKMELPLRAPHDGVVSEVRCEPGDLVQPGVLLMEIR
jgi:acetyl/propionyl-CoA carboxylase alpha subunit